MSKLILMAFGVVLLASLVLATPAKKKTCYQDCIGETIKELCAGRNGKKEISFGSVCALNNYNCEHGGNILSKVSDGECPGGGGIRLS